MAHPRTLAVRNPRTGESELTLTVASADDVARSADRLRANQPRWEALGLAGRIEVMRRWLGEVAQRAELIGERDAADTGGVSTSWSQGYITMANIGGWIADAETALARAEVRQRSVPMPDVEVRSQLVPYGLVGVISPWNAPMMLALLDAVPALFAGSAVLLKPSEVTPRFLAPLFDSVRAVPELAEVFDYVLGDGATGADLIANVDMVCFTGSVPTGRKVALACAERLIPAYLELGGKDPAIVTETADIDRATTAVLRGAVYATGQVCYSIERVYVHESIHDEFVAELLRKAESVTLNDRDPKEGHLGPFIFERQAEIVRSHLDDATAKGARVLAGGVVENLGGGLYMRPTILVGVDHDMAIMQEETFGPTIPVMAFRTVDEAVSLANDTEFGLTASVIAGTEDEALAIAARIRAGSVFIQDTFLTFGKMRTIGTHSFGHSGIGGSRTGPDSIMRFIRRKALMTNHGSPADIRNDRYGVQQ
ncbi:aldehyde dehydrogenase family protein [Microbacterium sp. 18062]|uniref:aldehyde dehydrogenase family protein n=1 Tax=Microbacterium sp. 18062 TaxID=2681410 RepID=UPI00135C1549|nr:aldehyde dehydrogenase family protein [Microbacterium sp. 18062]